MATETEDVRFSGSPNTMIALTMLASTLSLALSTWALVRIGNLETFVAVMAIQESRQASGR